MSSVKEINRELSSVTWHHSQSSQLDAQPATDHGRRSTDTAVHRQKSLVHSTRCSREMGISFFSGNTHPLSLLVDHTSHYVVIRQRLTFYHILSQIRSNSIMHLNAKDTKQKKKTLTLWWPSTTSSTKGHGTPCSVGKMLSTATAKTFHSRNSKVVHMT